LAESLSKILDSEPANVESWRPSAAPDDEEVPDPFAVELAG
jgi:hypothetical protein